MKNIRFIIALLTCFIFISWGNLGHLNISYKSAACFPISMAGFNVWADSLSIHASDADNRKSNDPTESPKHFIDIDNYSEFNTKGRIASTYDSIVKIHGVSFVVNNGTLPWATKVAYDSLKSAFKRRAWHNAMLYASDLGHYVADGHMPLHLTANYDGAKTGQTGIHSRYESTMVSNYISSITNYTATTAQSISNVDLYIMNYIYANQKYVKTVLDADTYATNIAGNTTSSLYYSSLWSKLGITTTLFKNASRALADLIYNAWLEAGSPAFGSKLPNAVQDVYYTDLTVYPNPTSGALKINTPNILSIETFNCDGKRMRIDNTNEIDLSTLRNGIYVLKIYDTEGKIHQNKIMLQHR